MREKKKEMTLRNCYGKDGSIITDKQIKEYEPLQEILEMFVSLRRQEASIPLEKAG